MPQMALQTAITTHIHVHTLPGRTLPGWPLTLARSTGSGRCQLPTGETAAVRISLFGKGWIDN